MKPKTFDDLYAEAERHDDYWVARLVHGFTESLVRRMDEQGVSRAELARRLGTSPAYVTKILRGDVNFTLATLVKLARAVEAEVRLELCEPPGKGERSNGLARLAGGWSAEDLEEFEAAVAGFERVDP